MNLIRLCIAVLFAQLLLVPAVPRASDDEYCADYLTPSGKYVSVLREGVTAETARLMVTIWETGRVGALVATDAGRFTIAPLDADGNAPTVVFSRSNGGRITGLTIESADSTSLRAVRTVTYREDNLLYSSSGATLAGTLKLPLGEGPFPGIVLVPGSGPAVCESVESMARFFVHRGMAVLTYDKRGCGASTGDWKQSGLDLLTNDALMGVAVLCARDEVDPDRVGLWGVGQGGWIAPLAASRSSRVAFVINHSGPATTMRRQETYMTSRALQMRGIPQPDIDLAVAVLNTLYDFARGKASAQQLDAAIAQTVGHPGLGEFASLTSQNIVADSLYAQQPFGDPAWFLHMNPDRDALEPYRLLQCPLLVVYGRLDYTVPVEESVRAINTALAAVTREDYAIAVLERTGHGMLVMNPDAPQSPVVPLTLAMEYFVLLGDWLSSRGF